MKQFFKMMFASALGVFVAVGLISIVFVFTLIGIAANVGSTPDYTPKSNTVYKLTLEGNLSDNTEENPIAMLMGETDKSLSLKDILSSIQTAKENKNIKGIYIEAKGLSTGSASLEAIRRALNDFKESGKFIVAYSDNYTQGCYYLCSVADKVFLNPQGTLGLVGMASQTMFYKDLLKKVTGLSKVSNIPAIEKESEIIHAILNTNYLEYSGIDEFENIRLRLRDLIKYIPRQGLSYETNFEDDILDVQFNDSELENDDLKNYKSKIEYYIRQHQKDDPVILKIKENKPLSSTDLVSLENILWKELGSKKDYYSEVGEKPICEFVREIVGLDMNAAKDAFSKYLDERNLNSEQIYFVNQIVEYIVRNGLMKDMSVLQQSPFTDKGSVADLFGNDIQTWMEIKSVIDNINNNANYN